MHRILDARDKALRQSMATKNGDVSCWTWRACVPANQTTVGSVMAGSVYSVMWHGRHVRLSSHFSHLDRFLQSLFVPDRNVFQTLSTLLRETVRQGLGQDSATAGSKGGVCPC